MNPRTGRERTLRTGRSARRVLVVGAGPAGVSAALEAAGRGDAVLLLERDGEIGGQLRLAGRAPAHRETWRRFASSFRRRLAHAGVALRLGVEAGPEDADGHDLVVLATGARPYAPPLPAPADGGPAVVDAWRAIAQPAGLAGPVLVADWGGGWTGLDAAEVLAEAGHDVALACAAPCPGDDLHQYQRNLYLARLDERGIPVRHHLELTGDLALRHVFSGRLVPLGDVATVVLAQGRVPADELWAELEGRPGCVRAGDVLGPRSAEEAVLEGALAVSDPARAPQPA